jgi:tRNA modification GTPase
MSGELQDTICAIATPVGEGGVGILRISGEKAIEVAAGLVRLRSGRSLDSVKSHAMHHADLLEAVPVQEAPTGLVQARNRRPASSLAIDEALIVVMRAPRSYTAEDVVIHRGARLAEPGEFTKRAFLNGRLDLTQAEAVLDTIRAKTVGSLRIAQEQLQGGLSVEIDRMREALIRLLAHVEAAIDFTEEDLAFIQPQALAGDLQKTIEELSRLAGSCREGRILRDGVTAAIIGRPNVGKSSLLNSLLRTDRAIVTPVPGTTRDVLEEVLNIRGVPVRLFDTAGIHATENPVEQEGIRRSLTAMEQAELLLIVLDGSMPLAQEDHELLARHRDKKRLVVINKTDLPCQIDSSTLAGLEHDDQPCTVVRRSTGPSSGDDSACRL